MSNLKKASILFSRLRQNVIAREKGTYVYQVDKTAAQKYVENAVSTLQKRQKFWDVRV